MAFEEGNEDKMTDYTVGQIWRFPVKTLGGERLEEAEIGPAGLPLDRHWALYQADTGTRLRSMNTAGALDLSARALTDARRPAAEITFPDGRCLTTGDTRLDAALSDHFARPITLREADTAHPTFHYDGIVTLLTESALRFLQEEAPHAQLSPRRFRANFLLAGTSPDADIAADWAERRWVGRDVTLGGARLAVTGNVERCIVTTRPQPAHAGEEALPRDPAIMQALIRRTGNRIAVHCQVRESGPVRLGDPARPA